MSESVSRALKVLAFLAERPRSQAEVAREVGVNRSTALRLMRTLAEHGFVVGEPPTYRVGPRFIALAEQALNSFDLRTSARPYLEKLRDNTGHTVHLAGVVGASAVYLDQLYGFSTLRLYASPGKAIPMYCTGVGKAILAFLPEDERASVCRDLHFVRHTATTLLNYEQLLAELTETCGRGYSVDDGEDEELVRCIGAPIFSSSGRVTGAVSITAINVPMDALIKLAPDVMATAASISAERGWIERE